MTENAPTLPGFEPPEPPTGPGEIEQATIEQIDALRDMGYVQPHHSGQAALTIATARALDRAIAGRRGAASGIANLSRALKENFEMLPMPEIASTDDLKLALERILDEEQPSDV
jgi:hypothetical protein